MDRRKFIRDVSIWSAAAGAIPVFTVNREAQAAENGKAVVAVAEGEDWYGLVKKTLDPLGGMEAFVKPGQKVVIKPNASFDRTPEQGANVHPKVLKAVIELALGAGAKEVIVFDRTLAEERRCWQNSGIGPMIESITDKRLRIDKEDERKYVPVKIDKGIAFTSWKFYKEVVTADSYINVPVAKHHSAAKLTMGIKNVLGLIGGNRGKVHWSLDQGLVDLNTVAKPTLTVIDATRILLRNGPSGGDLADVEVKNTVMASGDVAAADAYCAKSMFGMDPSEIGYLQIAGASGLGVTDLSKVEVKKA